MLVYVKCDDSGLVPERGEGESAADTRSNTFTFQTLEPFTDHLAESGLPFRADGFINNGRGQFLKEFYICLKHEWGLMCCVIGVQTAASNLKLLRPPVKL